MEVLQLLSWISVNKLISLDLHYKTQTETQAKREREGEPPDASRNISHKLNSSVEGSKDAIKKTFSLACRVGI